MGEQRCRHPNGSPKRPWALGVAVLVFLVSSTMFLGAGCASKQEVETTQRHQKTERFECLPERWAEPPKDIGQTPPDRAPNARDIDPFLETNTKIQD